MWLVVKLSGNLEPALRMRSSMHQPNNHQHTQSTRATTRPTTLTTCTQHYAQNHYQHMASTFQHTTTALLIGAGCMRTHFYMMQVFALQHACHTCMIVFAQVVYHCMQCTVTLWCCLRTRCGLQYVCAGNVHGVQAGVQAACERLNVQGARCIYTTTGSHGGSCTYKTEGVQGASTVCNHRAHDALTT